MTTKARAFLTGVRGAVPIAAGYVPIAFSFGVAASKLGLTAFEAFMLSLIIYAVKRFSNLCSTLFGY